MIPPKIPYLKGTTYTGISRDITPTLLPLIERPEALVLTGIRRGGKSTIMFQLVEALVAQGTDRTSILYVNFDFCPFHTLPAPVVKRQLMPDLSTRNNSAICCCVSQAVSTCTSGLWRAA
jgi:hypothetical protein